MMKQVLHYRVGLVILSGLTLCGCNQNYTAQEVSAPVATSTSSRSKTPKVLDGKTQNPVKSEADCMAEVNNLKVGMTQKDVLKVLERDGGTSTRTRRTYYHPTCQNEDGFLKVSIVFKPVTGPRDNFYNYPNDVIIKISQPVWALGNWLSTNRFLPHSHWPE